MCLVALDRACLLYTSAVWIHDRVEMDTPAFLAKEVGQIYRLGIRLSLSLIHISYFNALQVKFAYAVTCHKAQGGQWSHVYVDPVSYTHLYRTEIIIAHQQFTMIKACRIEINLYASLYRCLLYTSSAFSRVR